jgi:hypothetical protein
MKILYVAKQAARVVAVTLCRFPGHLRKPISRLANSGSYHYRLTFEM